MNWDKANHITKQLVFLLVQIFLIAGACAASLSIGVISGLLLRDSVVSEFVALMAGVATYIGLGVGRRSLLDGLHKLLF